MKKTIDKEQLVKLGHFAKPHGVKGEITLVTRSEAWEEMAEPYLFCEIDGCAVPFFIESLRRKGDEVLLVKLEGLETDEAVLPLSRKEVLLPADVLEAECPDEAISWDSLVGYTLLDEQGQEIGEILEVDDTTCNILLRVGCAEAEWWLPAALPLLVGLDPERREVALRLPEGIFDL